MLNEDQDVTFVAGATEALIGCSPGELMGQNFIDLVAESDRTLAQQLINIAKKRNPKQTKSNFVYRPQMYLPTGTFPGWYSEENRAPW